MAPDFLTRKAADNYLKHFGFHKVINSSCYSNGKYLAYVVTYAGVNDKKKISLRTQIDFFPIETRLIPTEITRKVENSYYADKESEIIAR